MNSVERGKRGEEIAYKYLKGRGLALRERNSRCGHLEVDLIMEDERFIRFIEVRSREYPAEAEPFETIDKQKQNRIISAAGGYVKRNGISKEVVFDVVSVLFLPSGERIEYFPEAFAPEW